MIGAPKSEPKLEGLIRLLLLPLVSPIANNGIARYGTKEVTLQKIKVGLGRGWVHKTE